MKFGDDAAKGPDVYLPIVGQTENDFGSSVVPALYVGVDSLIFEAAWSEINDFNARFVGFLEQYVLRFEVCMNHLIPVQEVNSIKNLKDKSPN